MGGRRRRFLAGEQGGLVERMAQQPDLTVRALAHELRERGYAGVSHNTVWSLLRAAGFSFKTYGPPRLQVGRKAGG